MLNDNIKKTSVTPYYLLFRIISGTKEVFVVLDGVGVRGTLCFESNPFKEVQALRVIEVIKIFRRDSQSQILYLY